MESKLIPVNGEYLTLTHYKEPLKDIPKKKGFGYYGALLSTIDGGLIQCHVCGKLFADVGKHSVQAHKLGAVEYREQFQLMATTALCSEKERERRKSTFLKWLETLSDEEKEAFKQRQKERGVKGREKRSNNQPKERLESKNLKGTCPDQLLEKIKEVALELGHIPSKHEFIGACESQRYVHLIYKTFGSWKNALYILNMQPRESRGNIHKHLHYSDDELLEYLTIFAQENNKIPTATDFRRGLLPSYSIYTRRFGGIENARQLANVYDFIEVE